ncbi:hypothetical protein DOTSEDRAFT_30268 [Dothistroma septosporum NZE10]|uniref:Uncharacterized protein n=1 Tax=Dothistroma septosporum (strain NZE10 / CBS 128990) TaxID=675120 RepID=N1PZG0_DOTSN|nr:hypothetical protein DOTSEDRAFT_30268 [Dothistroma septosporum NZE10]
MGEYDIDATIETTTTTKSKRHEYTKDPRVENASKGSFKYYLVVRSTSERKGSVGITAVGSLLARNINAEEATKINSHAALETAQSVNGPGFEVLIKRTRRTCRQARSMRRTCRLSRPWPVLLPKSGRGARISPQKDPPISGSSNKIVA